MDNPPLNIPYKLPEPGYTLFGVFLKGPHFFKGVKHVYKPERSPFWMRCKQKNMPGLAERSIRIATL